MLFGFKVYCQLFIPLPHCWRHLVFSRFPVSPAASSINLNAIRLTAARNENGSIMTYSGLTLKV